MSDENLARRVKLQITINGADVSQVVDKYLKNFTYTDNEDTDDNIELELEDTNYEWLKWLGDENLNLTSSIDVFNWNNYGTDSVLDAGTFDIDDIEASGPPASIMLAGTSLPYDGAVRQTLKTKAWEQYNLSNIVCELAAAAGLTVMYESVEDPLYDRAEQIDQSDFDFIRQLCTDAGISLKATNKTLVLYDIIEYEKKEPVFTIERKALGSSGYSSYRFRKSKVHTEYSSCIVSYMLPGGGKGKVTYTVPGATGDQVLKVNAKVWSIAEGEALAKARVRAANSKGNEISLTMPGNPLALVGVTVMIKGFDLFDSKYIITQAAHSVSKNGYRTSVKLRRVLEGY